MAQPKFLVNNDARFDLESFRDRIQHLYVEERHSLKVIMKILNEEGCNASRNMYLKKIQAWKLNKYRKQEDMLQEQLTEQNIKPEATMVAKQLQRRVNHYPGQETLYLGLLAQQPEELELSHQFFKSTYDLQRSIVSNLLTERPKNGDQINTSSSQSRFLTSLIDGTALMAKNDTQTGGALIERGLRVAELTLRELRHDFLRHITFVTLSMMFHKVYDLSLVFVKFMHQLSSTVLGFQHGVTRLFYLLYRQQSEKDRGDHVNLSIINLTYRGLQVIYDATSNTAGQFDPISIEARIILIMTARMVNPSVENLCSLHESFIRDCNHLLPVYGIIARRNYGIYLYTINRISDAIPLLREGGSILFRDPASTSKEAISMAIQCCYEWAELLMMQAPDKANDLEAYQKQYLEAEQLLKFTIEKSILLMGPQSHETLTATKALAEFYDEHGQPEKASAQQDYVMDLLSEFKLE